MKTLVLAEKPSVARDIARVLKCRKNLNGAIEGDKYIVTWGLGHLVTLADPESYDKKFKEWKMEDLPMMPQSFKLEVIKQTGKQYQTVKTQLHRKDVKDIIIATDAGREGELVARWILMKAGNQKPTQRLWISSVTDKAILAGFSNLKRGRDYDSLFDAAVSRAEADWLVGLNATRALTCKYNASLSCGRVQTPTLGMIAKREEEIKSFRPVPYYGIQAKGQNMPMVFTWQDKKSGGFRAFEKNRIEEIMNAINGKKGQVVKVERTPKKTFPPMLYDLTQLQREANQKFNFSAKETLNILQRLYENHKVLTYPRTDSRYLSSDIIPTLKERLSACGTGPYRKIAAKAASQPIPSKPSFVDNSKVSDHHGIIPTEEYVKLEHMTIEERKVYDMVVRRFLAVFYPPFLYEQTTIQLQVGSEIFAAKGKIVKNSGWKEVYENQYEEEEDGEEDLASQELSEMKQGDTVSPIQLKMTEGKTKPPAPFTEGTLIGAMENPVKFMASKDKLAIKTLGETGGLGTVATRADIIEKLFSSFLLEKKGKDLYITSKGKQLLELVPEDLKQPELTADWEMKLSKIANGTLSRRAFMEEIQKYSKELTQEIKTGKGSFRHDNLTNQKCPECGKRLLSVKGKNAQMLVCQDRECGYRETVSRTSNARCPVCHKRMEMWGKGEKQAFVCACGHKEKLSAFQERRKREGGGVSKKDVANYMKNQQKESVAPANNAFADAFAKLNLK